MDEAERDYANFHLVFMMRLSRFIGFFPNLDAYQAGACFDLRNATFTTTVPLHSDYPINVIKKAGVDMEKEDYLNAAFAVFERRLDEFEALVEKLGLA